MYTSFCINDFVLLYRTCYDVFQVLTALLNISFQSGSYVLTVLGENIPK